MKIDICIVSYNTKNILYKCLKSVIQAVENSNIKDVIEYAIHVVDNASHDGTVDMIQKNFPEIKLVNLEINLGFARANNIIFSKSYGKYFILLNPDAFIHEDTLTKAISFMENTSKAGACGGLLRNEDGSLAPSARRFPTLIRKFCDMWGLSRIVKKKQVSNKSQEVDWVPGTFTVVRRSAFINLPLFDERFFLYYEETDMCRALHNRGWQVWFVPEIELVHIGGASAMAHVKNESVNTEGMNAKQFFDTSGAQLTLWRMQSENLYINKYLSKYGVLVNATIEITRHATRIASNGMRYFYYINFLRYKNNSKNSYNTIKKKNSAYIKKNDSQQKIILLIKALSNTQFGQVSPKIPWE